MDNNSIKENLKKYRKNQKVTQVKLANKLGISSTSYRKIEKIGETQILHDSIPLIAEILDISAEEIILGYNPHEVRDTKLEDTRTEYNKYIAILEEKIANLETLVASQRETIRSQEDSIKSKNEIIAMLKKKIDQAK